jgi:hypothetical protein
MYPSGLLKNFVSIGVSLFYPFLGVQISLPCRRMAIAGALYTFILEDIWTKGGLKMLLKIPRI